MAASAEIKSLKSVLEALREAQRLWRERAVARLAAWVALGGEENALEEEFTHERLVMV